MKSKSILQTSLLLSTSLLVVACNDSDDSDSKTTENDAIEMVAGKAHLRVLHASSDAPEVNVWVNGEVALPSVDYTEGSSLLALDQATYDLAVEGIIPSGNAVVIDAPGQKLMADTIYEVVAAGDVAGIEPIIVSRPAMFDETKSRVTVLHAADDAPKVDVHVTAPNAVLSADTVLTSFEFKDTAGPLEVDSGDYHIRITLAGNPQEVIYDSGVVPLSAGSDYFIAAIENETITNSGANKSPVVLAVSADDAAAALIYSTNDGAELRVIHNVGDAPEVDVVANDNFSSPLVSNLAFKDVAGYLNVPADDYNVKVAVAGTQTSVIDADLTLDNSGVYSVYAMGDLETIAPLVLLDNPRAIATNAQVRVIHGSTLAGNVDVYVTAVDAVLTGINPAISDFEFKDDSGYISLSAGLYDVTITQAGSKTAALGPVEISIENSGIYNYLARDNENLDGVGIIAF
ncbi:DUF4397 domain-containing protein [Marinicellulosiphila megalodicopiae]|uniref:DUF4397 domain-containing protein n=1 Tax=Marinicellulosiphila megalodicopiae TaxID=2724896 RepID=UPI003BAFE957